jgi:nitrous oxidase accessory protein NosD
MPALSTAAGATDIVYLDVWQRDVTALQDPELLEPALGGPGGPDTTTRVQSAWQVKVLPNVPAQTCEDEPQEWLDLIAPSTARLTADAVPGPVTAQPCVIDPAGGYTGLENRLYRVEVHVAGTLGAVAGTTQARFKWSRDNATLAARVLAITPDVVVGQSRIAVASLGRDRFLRFERNDFVELLDDDVEFAMRETGTGGAIARIVDVDVANSILVVDQDLTPFNVVVSRHPRVRRWDVDPLAQPAQAVVRDATPGGVGVAALALEAGIGISFSTDPAATLHAGDYWVFAARTALGALLDPPVDAPPHGGLHHYCKLAVAPVGAPPEDCREHWPPDEGCCSEVVEPGESIQAAIDRLPPTGGCVCLKTGVHIIGAALHIAQSNVCLQGETLGAIVRRPSGETMLFLGNPAGVRIHNLCVEKIRFEGGTAPEGEPAMLVAAACDDVTIRECEFAGIDDAILGAVAIATNASGPLAIERNQMRSLLGGVQVAFGAVVSIHDNVILGPTFEIDLAGVGRITISIGVFGVQLEDDCGPQNSIRHNIIHDYREGVRVGRGAEATVIADNRIRRQGQFFNGPIEPLDIFGGGTGADPATVRAFGIVSRGPFAIVRHNSVVISEPSQGGVLVMGSDSVVEHNSITGSVTRAQVIAATSTPLGVLLASELTGDTPVRRCAVRENMLTGLMGAITVVGSRAPVDDCEVIANRIEGIDGVVEPLEGDVTDDSIVTVADQLFAIVITTLEALNIGYGIGVLGAGRCTIMRNTIRELPLGIACASISRTRIAENHLVHTFAGITVVFAETPAIEDNTVVRSHVWAVLCASALGAVVAGNRVRQTFAAAILMIFGVDARVSGNDVQIGGYGIVLLAEQRAEVRDNIIDSLRRTGIAALFAVESYRCIGNRVSRCGREGSPVTLITRTLSVTVPLAVGISALYSIGHLEVEDCHVSGTGEPGEEGGAAFPDIRVPVLVYGVLRVRVHGCTLLGALGAAVDRNSYVLFVNAEDPFTPEPEEPTCDVLDTLAEGRGETIVQCTAARGELTFATNRCRNYLTPRTTDAAVMLLARFHALTGNRIRVEPERLPPLRVQGTRMTATSNITTGPPLLVLTNPEVPLYNTANLIV